MTVRKMTPDDVLEWAIRAQVALSDEAFRLRRRGEDPADRRRAIDFEDLAAEGDAAVVALRSARRDMTTSERGSG
jgi:hypothetical protein